MLLIGDQWIGGDQPLEVRSPWNGCLVGTVARAEDEHVRQAVAAARAALARPLSAHRRSQLLRAVADRLADRREPVARLIMSESGKPVGECRQEVDRAVVTARFAAEEALRLGGEVLPCDVTAQEVDRRAMSVRVPLGVIAAVTPFNFPLNVLMHKVAPALAAGNAVILKPSPRTPLTANRVGEVALACGWPAGWLGILHGGADTAVKVAAADVNGITLTGGAAAGRAVADHAFGKRLLLELGGNDPLIVADDADLPAALDVAVAQRFGSAGQRCTSCKRLFVHRSRFEDALAELIPRVEALVVGDPADDATDVGPLITDEAADRVEARLECYRAAGAVVRAGGRREGRLVWPTVVTGVDPLHPEALEETFGPLLPVYRFDELDEVVDWTNAAPAGLQAGVFTNRLDVVHQLFRRLAVGTLVVNGGPNFRIESLPFGGLKQGGYAREGVRFAMEEMTALKTLVL